ncbi:MAG: insulinase family protein, partial [Deltaproteobacteria bacterium]|nr:insulinase family protein [Kofleriaceae bacterium]
MRRALGVVLLVVVSCGSPKKGAWRPGPGDDLPQPARTVLVPRPEAETEAAGGFRVVVVLDPLSRQIELGLRVRTGHVDDPPGKEGLAHLVEHLVFELRPAGPGTPSFEERLQSIATGVNATVDLEATHYVASASRALAPRVAEILADIPRHATCAHIDRRVFEREREVVRNELHLRGDVTSYTLRDALTAAAYTTDHPYRRVSHTSASLDAITWEDVCDFLKARYRPAEMFLVLGGGVQMTRLAPLLAPFDPIAVEAPAPVPAVPEMAAVRARLKVEADVDDDLVMLVWPLPGRYSPDGIAGRTIAAWLGGALARAERKGRIGASRVGVFGGPRAPYMVATVERGDESADAILKIVVDVAGHLWDEIDSDNAFLVRQAAVRAIFDELVPESGRTRLLADYTQFDADGSLSSDVDRLGAMRRDDLAALTRRMITVDRASVVEVVAADGIAGKEPELRTGVAEPPGGTAVPDALGDELTQAWIDVSSFELGNGLEVVLAPTSFSPLVQARLVVPGGLADADNPAVPLYAALALAPPDDGPGVYGAAGLLLMSPLADYDVRVGAFSTTFEVSALGGWQDVVVWGLARLVRAGAYEPDDVARVLERARKALPAAGDRDASRRRK